MKQSQVFLGCFLTWIFSSFEKGTVQWPIYEEKKFPEIKEPLQIFWSAFF